jgi:hypothetical protein
MALSRFSGWLLGFSRQLPVRLSRWLLASLGRWLLAGLG